MVSLLSKAIESNEAHQQQLQQQRARPRILGQVMDISRGKEGVNRGNGHKKQLQGGKRSS